MSTGITVSTRLHLPSPQTLGCETEVDMSLWLDVIYDPGVTDNEAAHASRVEILDWAEHRVDLTVGEVRLNLGFGDQRLLFESWARRDANMETLKAMCAKKWNEGEAVKHGYAVKAEAETQRQLNH